MSQKTLSRSSCVALAAVLAAVSGNAAALGFMSGENPLRGENLFTIGASWRMQDRDPAVVGSSNLSPGLCLVREKPTSYESGPLPYPEAAPGEPGTLTNQYGLGLVPEACTTTDMTRDRQYIAYQGSNNPNSDQGNLNFDKGDMVHAIAK